MHMVDQGVNGIISFSSVPLRLALYFGITLSGLSFIYAFGVLVMAIIGQTFPARKGIPTVIVALFFFSGIQLLFAGILGEYILAIYNQVRRRPLIIERERVNFD